MEPLPVTASQACNLRLHHIKVPASHKGSARQCVNLELGLRLGHFSLLISVEELTKKRITALVGKVDPNYHEVWVASK